ncbi:MAG: thiamine phosphate synthase [Alphaproteobacteria bacterium]|nr:thiamine phosphate synthase [Alphaproteobacteria bacterium]|tara:strand:+ start:2375 stop:3031 length:657 start_codon:yes stop_codon:yes gene_type:complete
MSNYHSYFIAGPENISPNHMIGKESKEQALVRIVKNLALSGLDVFQLRAKNLEENQIIKILYNLKLSIKDTNTKLCINDNVYVASKTKDIIDIVHLGQSDMHPDIARNLIGDGVEIGLSITNESQLASIPKCVKYIGVGPIYNTDSKDDASKPIGEKKLKEIILKTNLPVVAIGGISLNNIKNLFELGVSGVAVISNILNENDPLENFLLLKKQIYKD